MAAAVEVRSAVVVAVEARSVVPVAVEAHSAVATTVVAVMARLAAEDDESEELVK